MEDIVNIGTFVEHLTYFIKVGIYINKGTTKENTLERCIKLYNKFKTIEATREITDEDEAAIRRCLKRLNLVLKVDSKGKPIDLTNKENQLRMALLSPHTSLENDDMESLIDHATKYNINILTEIPLLFILRDSKYKKLLWQYTRSLFYISQIIVSKVSPSADPTDKIVIAKQKISDNCIDKLGTVLVTISEIEKEINLSKVLALDKFLNTKLIKTGINEDDVDEANQEVKEIFKRKGLDSDNSIMKMVDSISSKLKEQDLTQGNIFQNMFKIAEEVTKDVRADMEAGAGPEKIQNTIGAITEVFQEAMENTGNSDDQIPSEIKSVFKQLMSATPLTNGGSTDQNIDENEILKSLENIIQTNGLDRDEFFKSIVNNGEIDTSKISNLCGDINTNKLENLLTSINSNGSHGNHC
jgi:hypothetical protein